MMASWLGVSVSALALACAAPSAQAGEVTRPVIDRFSSETLLAPSLSAGAISDEGPVPAAFLVGMDAIADASSLPGTSSRPDAATPTIDGIVTGQIAKPARDGEAAQAESTPAALAPEAASAEPVSAPAPTEPVAAAPAASETATAAEHAEGDGHDAPVFPETRNPAPFDIIRTVQFLQDQISRGNGRAIRVQAALLRRFGPVFLAADGEVWKDGRNRRAAVLFVLSGGPPEVLRRLLQAGALENDPEALFQGALFYVQNDMEQAQKLLSQVDLTGMEPGLAAHIHLVLGQMQQTTSPDEAIRNLDQARLLAPGGLIEEAALRMEVLIAEGKGDHAAADRLARQYFDRYARSSYSANFEARFAAVYAGRAVEDAKTSVETILDVTERLAPVSRRSLLLAVARRALVDGKLNLAELASDAAGAIEGIADNQKQRAELYATAARLGKSPTSDATVLLDAIKRDELHPDDAQLLDAAHSVIASIERPVAKPEGDEGEAMEASPVVSRAEKILSDVSDDLEKVQK